MEGERGEKEEGETLAGRVGTDLLHQLGPPVEHDEGPLGQQGNPPRVHLIMTSPLVLGRGDERKYFILFLVYPILNMFILSS